MPVCNPRFTCWADDIFFCAPHKWLPPCDTGVAFMKSRNWRYESTVARLTKEQPQNNKRVIARRLSEALRKHCHPAACKTDVLPGSKVRGELCHIGCKQCPCAVNGQTRLWKPRELVWWINIWWGENTVQIFLGRVNLNNQSVFTL